VTTLRSSKDRPASCPRSKRKSRAIASRLAAPTDAGDLGSLPQGIRGYIRWQAFALWARDVVENGGCDPSGLNSKSAKTWSRVCGRSALQTSRNYLDYSYSLPWVHSQAFGFFAGGRVLMRGCYGFRMLAPGQLKILEQCESEWKRTTANVFPTFWRWGVQP